MVSYLQDGLDEDGGDEERSAGGDALPRLFRGEDGAGSDGHAVGRGPLEFLDGV